MTAVRQQVSVRPEACGGLIHEPREGPVAHENQKVDIAPVICLAAAERTDQGHAADHGVSLQQAKHLIEQTVTQVAKKRRPGCHRPILHAPHYRVDDPYGRKPSLATRFRSSLTVRRAPWGWSYSG